ncbi:MAG TPA: hydroxymethylpyrimidine/phosphomethylpyrimidine kinase [candidate division Zixibacteria bacterium]|nr:hydroxymethylpyrimidine/phosphomethylpyrimidine kinase [candidate division Zixibacteria bacterium]
MKTILVISGLDPTGGAGISADIRAISSCGNIVAPVISAFANQGNSEGGHVHVTPLPVFDEAMDFALSTTPDTVKIGMLGTREIIEVVAGKLSSLKHLPPIVIDPVMSSTSGMKLLSTDGIEALVERLFPIATLITPNIAEAEALTRIKIEKERDIEAAGEFLITRCRAVLIKGGHIAGPPTDYFFSGEGTRKFSSERVSGEFRGTGCALASLIASNLADGLSIFSAVKTAKDSLTVAMKQSEPPYLMFL